MVSSKGGKNRRDGVPSGGFPPLDYLDPDHVVKRISQRKEAPGIQ